MIHVERLHQPWTAVTQAIKRSLQQALRHGQPSVERAIASCRDIQGRMVESFSEGGEMHAIIHSLRENASIWHKEAQKYIHQGREHLARVSLQRERQSLREAEELMRWREEYFEMRQEFLKTLDKVKTHLSETEESFRRFEDLSRGPESDWVDQDCAAWDWDEEVETELRKLKAEAGEKSE